VKIMRERERRNESFKAYPPSTPSSFVVLSRNGP
jgi:hypothetical protein